MVAETSKLIVDIEVNVTQAQKSIEELQKTLKGTAASTDLVTKIAQDNTRAVAQQALGNHDLDKALKATNLTLNKFGQFEETFTGTAVSAKRAIDALRKSTRRFNFDFLTLIFGGLVLKRVFGGALKSILNTFTKVRGENSEFTKATNRLTASFEFLKFTIASALDTPLFVAIIDFIVEIINRISEFLSANPAASRLILGLIAALAAGGVIALMLGSLIQIKDAINLIFGLNLFSGEALTNAGTMNTLISGIGKTIAAIGVFKLIVDLTGLEGTVNEFDKIMDDISLILIGVGFTFKGAGLGYALALTIGIQLLKFLPEEVKEILLDIFRTGIEFAKVLIKGFFEGIAQFIKDPIGSIKDFFTTTEEETAAFVQRIGTETDTSQIARNFDALKDSVSAAAKVDIKPLVDNTKLLQAFNLTPLATSTQLTSDKFIQLNPLVITGATNTTSLKVAIDPLIITLNNETTALNSAATAQERYNAAKQGRAFSIRR